MWGGPLRVMMTRDQEPNSDLVCFCDVVARDPFFIIGAKPRPDFRFADLKTLRFATVSEVPTPWICLADDIRRAGVDPDALPRIADRSMDDNEAALRAGTVDAIHVFQPHAERLLASGAGHVWYAAAIRGLTAYTTLVTRRPVLAQREDEMLKRAERSNALIYAVSTARLDTTVGNERLLRKLARSTGGELYTPRTEREVVEAFAEIGAKIRQGYTIGYVPTNGAHDGTYRKLIVRALMPGMRTPVVHVRDGYLSPLHPNER